MTAFRFKQFAIDQDRCAMKVSLDACVLGALCRPHNDQPILDIGTGSGLLALMIAQRSEAHIDAIELDAGAAQQARENVKNSPFSSRVSIHGGDISQFNSANKYGLVVCNPPFFSDHLKGPNAQRNRARHNDGLSFMALCQSLQKHLDKDGKAWILLPCSEFSRFMASAAQANLQLEQRWLLSSRPQKAPHRVIFTLMHRLARPLPSVDQHLVVHPQHGSEYSAAFKSLLRDYYLKL